MLLARSALVLVAAFVWPLAQLAQAASPDPTSQFTQLGVSAVAVGIMFLAWRKAETRAEASNVTTNALINVLREVQPVVARSIEVHKDAIEAEHEMTRAMQAMPPQQVWWEIRAALAARPSVVDRRDDQNPRQEKTE